MVSNKINITRTDPIRIRIQNDLSYLRNIKTMGTVITGYRDLEGADPIHDFFISIKTKDTKPNEPEKESFKETIDKVIEQFNVRQDVNRSHKIHNAICGFNENKDTEWYVTVNEKKFAKMGNKYDVFIDKLDFNNKNNLNVGKVKF